MQFFVFGSKNQATPRALVLTSPTSMSTEVSSDMLVWFLHPTQIFSRIQNLYTLL